MLIIAYYMAQRQCTYQELGGDYFNRLNADSVKYRIVQKLRSLGFEVTLTPITPVSPELSAQAVWTTVLAGQRFHGRERILASAGKRALLNTGFLESDRPPVSGHALTRRRRLKDRIFLLFPTNREYFEGARLFEERRPTRESISGGQRFIANCARNAACSHHGSWRLGFKRFALHLGRLNIEQLANL